MSVAVYMTGEPDQPYRANVSWVDFSTALHAAFGTMAALMAKRQTGQGQRVETALLANAVTLTNALLIEQDVAGTDRVPTGNHGQTAAPVDIFRTRDGWVMTHVVGTPLYKRWARLMGEPDWLNDPRFADDISRGDNSVPISARMAAGAPSARRPKQSRPSRGAYSGRPGAEAAAGAGRPACPGNGLLSGSRFPRPAQAGPAGPRAVKLSGTPGAIQHRAPAAGRAHRRDPGRTRLRRRSHHRAAPAPGDLV
ncbi:MAG: CoA transferase [Aliidongia sp.]